MNEQTINYLKAERLSRFWHLHKISEGIKKKAYKWNSINTRTKDRPKIRGKTGWHCKLS